MYGTAAAASGRSTVRRTSSEPARASSLICIAVSITLAVSVLVIDCTTTGASPPTQILRWPCETSTLRLARRFNGPEGIAVCVEDMIVVLVLLTYLMLTREIVPPATGGNASGAPPSVASTPLGLPTISSAGSLMSKVSVLPAFTSREISGVVPGRRISTHESCVTFSTSWLPLAVAAAGGDTCATGAAGAGAGVTAVGAGVVSVVAPCGG